MRMRIFVLLLLFSNAVSAITEDEMLLQIVGQPKENRSATLIHALPGQTVSSAWTAAKWGESKLQAPPLLPANSITASKASCVSYCDLIKEFSTRYQVPESLIMAVIKAESNFNTQAISHAGAKGLMQLMDVHSKNWNINPFEPKQNIKVGTALLQKLMKQYSSIDLVLAAYNAGEGAVAKYGGVPPYKETQQYIIKVKAFQEAFKNETNG